MIIKNYFDNSVILFKTKKFIDSRGFFSENYNYKYFKKIGINQRFVQDNYSYTKHQGTIRGMHLQRQPRSQSKIIKVLSGKILDIIVDLRKNSKTYGKSKSFTLSNKNEFQLFVPEGFAHGFCTLEKNTEVMYKVSNYYSPKHELTIHWSDKLLNLNWKFNRKKIIVNQKDSIGITLQEFEKISF